MGISVDSNKVKHAAAKIGRTSLIKSVLGHLPTFYMSIYPMPVTIVKKLDSMRNKFFLGGDMTEKKMSWVRWNQCFASKDLGGLGIGSISGLNIGLLFKWIRRFLCNSSALWVRVIKSIHGIQSGIHDTRQPRGGLEMNQFVDLHAKLENIVLTDQDDSWSWTLNPSGFSIASVRHLIDSKTLDTSPNATRWIRHISIKVNIFVWRLMLNKLLFR
nr:RNA-directed DNA polymerase, eukaryota, reverse transcriptase zinc-binding domain protein [Tanacetum cinerariifolium]